MPYCTECGSQVKESDKFCTNCGHLLKSIQSKQQTQTIGIETDFWGSQSFEEYKQVTAWIVDTNSKALLDLTTEILPYMKSHVIEQEDSVRITEEGGPASVYGLLFYLNWMSIIGRNTLNNFGIVN